MPGELTLVGLAQTKALGKFLRRRYFEPDFVASASASASAAQAASGAQAASSASSSASKRDAARLDWFNSASHYQYQCIRKHSSDSSAGFLCRPFSEPLQLSHILYVSPTTPTTSEFLCFPVAF